MPVGFRTLPSSASFATPSITPSSANEQRPRSVEHGVSQSEPNLSLRVKNYRGPSRELGLNPQNSDRSQKRAILLGGGPAGVDDGAMNAKANSLHCQAKSPFMSSVGGEAGKKGGRGALVSDGSQSPATTPPAPRTTGLSLVLRECSATRPGELVTCLT